MNIKLIFSIVTLVLGVCQAGNPWTGAAKDGNWVETHQRLVKMTADHKNEIQIVFIGDSITNRWQTTGKQLWDKYYVTRHAFDYGIEGDRTENVIYRIENKEFDGIKPKVVVLKIGIYKTFYNDWCEDCAGY